MWSIKRFTFFGTPGISKGNCGISVILPCLSPDQQVTHHGASENKILCNERNLPVYQSGMVLELTAAKNKRGKSKKILR